MRRLLINYRFTLCFVLIATVISSCVPTSYMPTVVNAPIFQSDKEIHAAGYFGLDHSELQMAYSIDTINGVVLNSYVGYNNLSFGKDTSFTKAFLFEGGYCYSKQLKGRYKTELIGGYGYGNKKYYEFNSKDNQTLYGEGVTTSYDIDNKVHRLFLQMNFGKIIGRKSDSKSSFAFSLRSVAQFYPSYKIFYEKYDLNNSYVIPIEKDSVSLKNQLALQIEPAFTVRFGFHPIYFSFQLSSSLPTSGHSIIRQYSNANLLVLGFGLHAVINHK